MGKIRHIAITAEDPFVTAELFKKALGSEARGDSDPAREVCLTDGYINLAIVCWKRTKETPNPYPDGYGLDHFGVHVDDLEGGSAPARPAPFPSRRRRWTSRSSPATPCTSREARARRREVRPLWTRMGDPAREK